jgi:hypothetical protein
MQPPKTKGLIPEKRRFFMKGEVSQSYPPSPNRALSLGLPTTIRFPMRFLMAIISLSLMVSACATVGDIKSDPLDWGAVRTFQAPFNETLTAARLAISEAALQMESDDKVTDGCWMLVGSRGSTIMGGSIVRVVVERESDTETSVRVFTRTGERAAAFQYPKLIFESIESTLETKQLKAWPKFHRDKNLIF